VSDFAGEETERKNTKKKQDVGFYEIVRGAGGKEKQCGSRSPFVTCYGKRQVGGKHLTCPSSGWGKAARGCFPDRERRAAPRKELYIT